MNQYLQELANRLQSCEDTDAKAILRIVGVDLYDYIQDNRQEEWNKRLQYGENLQANSVYLIAEKIAIQRARTIMELCSKILDRATKKKKEMLENKMDELYKNSSFETLKDLYKENSDVTPLFPATILRTAACNRILGHLSAVYEMGEVAKNLGQSSSLAKELDQLKDVLKIMEMHLVVIPHKLRLDSVEIVNLVGATWNPGTLDIDFVASRLMKDKSDYSAVKNAGMEVCYALQQSSPDDKDICRFPGGNIHRRTKVVTYKGIKHPFSSVDNLKVIDACLAGDGIANIEDIDERKTPDEIDSLLYKMNTPWRTVRYRVFRRQDRKVWVDPKPVNVTCQK